MTTTGPDYYEKQSAQDSRMAVLETKVQDLEEQLERFKDKDQEELNDRLRKLEKWVWGAGAVIGGGSIFGGNFALDQATGGPEKRIKAKQSELQLIVREEVRAAFAEMLPASTGGVVRSTAPGDYREEVPK